MCGRWKIWQAPRVHQTSTRANWFTSECVAWKVQKMTKVFKLFKVFEPQLCTARTPWWRIILSTRPHNSAPFLDAAQWSDCHWRIKPFRRRWAFAFHEIWAFIAEHWPSFVRIHVYGPQRSTHHNHKSPAWRILRGLHPRNLADRVDRFDRLKLPARKLFAVFVNSIIMGASVFQSILRNAKQELIDNDVWSEHQTVFVETRWNDWLLFLHRQNALELEQTRSKMDIRSLNNQLMEAIAQKIELSQQLEAWQVILTTFRL